MNPRDPALAVCLALVLLGIAAYFEVAYDNPIFTNSTTEDVP